MWTFVFLEARREKLILVDLVNTLPSGAKLLSAIAPKTKVGKIEFPFISRNIDVNKEKERLSPEYGDWLVSKVIKTPTIIKFIVKGPGIPGPEHRFGCP